MDNPTNGSVQIGETGNVEPVDEATVDAFKAANPNRYKTDKERFQEAGSFALTLPDGQSIWCERKYFSTGSKGWNANGKIQIQGLRVQVSVNLVVVGSKDW